MHNLLGFFFPPAPPKQLDLDDEAVEEAGTVVSIDTACSGDRSILACCSSQYVWLHYWGRTKSGDSSIGTLQHRYSM